MARRIPRREFLASLGAAAVMTAGSFFRSARARPLVGHSAVAVTEVRPDIQSENVEGNRFCSS